MFLPYQNELLSKIGWLAFRAQRWVVQSLRRAGALRDVFTNGMKLTAIVTTVCFMLTSVCGQVIAATTQEASRSDAWRGVLNEFILPYSVGRVTEGRNFEGSDTIVVNIQDLHCHAEVQRNISKILKMLDDRYGLDKVYIEGGVGPISTAWADQMSNAAERRDVVESLIDAGRLNGAEYYAIGAKKPDLLSGIEDDRIYNDNLVRLGKLMSMNNDVAEVMPVLKVTAGQLKERYFDNANQRLERLLAKYAAREMSADKFYELMFKCGERCEITREAYPAIDAFLTLSRLQQNVNFRAAGAQLRELLSSLRQELPYDTYMALIDKAGDLSRVDELYVMLARINAVNPRAFLSAGAELKAFLGFIDASQRLNPVQLVRDERRLIRDLHEALSVTGTERDIAFAVDFLATVEEYYENRISAEDYVYYRENVGRFDQVWAQYAKDNRLNRLAACDQLLETYYGVNIERNAIFARNMFGATIQPKREPIRVFEKQDQMSSVLSGLEKGKKIIVMVTGGFHTTGFAEILKANHISYLVITPAVSQDTGLAQTVYNELAREQAALLTQTMAVKAFSEMIAKQDAGAIQQFLHRQWAESLLNLRYRAGDRTMASLARGLNDVYTKLGINCSVSSTQDEISCQFNDEPPLRFSVAGGMIHFVDAGTDVTPRHPKATAGMSVTLASDIAQLAVDFTLKSSQSVWFAAWLARTMIAQGYPIRAFYLREALSREAIFRAELIENLFSGEDKRYVMSMSEAYDRYGGILEYYRAYLRTFKAGVRWDIRVAKKGNPALVSANEWLMCSTVMDASGRYGTIYFSEDFLDDILTRGTGEKELLNTEQIEIIELTALHEILELEALNHPESETGKALSAYLLSPQGAGLKDDVTRLEVRTSAAFHDCVRWYAERKRQNLSLSQVEEDIASQDRLLTLGQDIAQRVRGEKPRSSGENGKLTSALVTVRGKVLERITDARAAGAYAVCSVAMEMPVLKRSVPKGGGQGVFMKEQPWAVAQNAVGVASFVVAPLFSHEMVQDSGSFDEFLVKYHAQEFMQLEVPLGNGTYPLSVIYMEQEGVPVFLLYDKSSNLFVETYAAPHPDSLGGYIESIVLPRAAIMLQEALNVQFELYHFNDWQTALGPVFLTEAAQYRDNKWELGHRPATLFTVHNLEYQGIFPGHIRVHSDDAMVKYLSSRGVLRAHRYRDDPDQERNSYQVSDNEIGIEPFKLTTLPTQLQRDESPNGLEYWSHGAVYSPGKHNLMKGAISHADKVVFVSHGHKTESMTERGYGLGGVFSFFSNKLTAVYNGIRAGKHKPENVSSLRVEGFMADIGDDEVLWKETNKKALQVKLGLAQDTPEEKFMLIGAVSRLVKQKGLNVLLAPCGNQGRPLLEELLNYRGPDGARFQVVIMGVPGDDVGERIATYLREITARPEYKDVFRFIQVKDTLLFKQVGAGLQVGLMPSIDEPGGIANQEMAMLLNLVVVAARGGLVDFYENGGTPLKPVPGFDIASDQASSAEKRRAQEETNRSAQAIFDVMSGVMRIYVQEPESYRRMLQQVRAFHPDWSEGGRDQSYDRIYRSAIDEVSKPDSAPKGAWFPWKWYEKAISWWLEMPVSIMCGVGIAQILTMAGVPAGISTAVAIPLSGLFFWLGHALFRGGDYAQQRTILSLTLATAITAVPVAALGWAHPVSIALLVAASIPHLYLNLGKTMRAGRVIKAVLSSALMLVLISGLLTACTPKDPNAGTPSTSSTVSVVETMTPAEKASYEGALLWLQKNVSSATGLPFSYYVPKSDEEKLYGLIDASTEAGQIERILIAYGANTYDIAASQIAMIASGDKDLLAQAVIPTRAFWKGSVGSFATVRGGYVGGSSEQPFIYDPNAPSSVPGTVSAYGERGYVFRILSANGNGMSLRVPLTINVMTWPDWQLVTGENAWQAISACQWVHASYYDEATGKYTVDLTQQDEVKFAQEIARCSLLLQADNGGIRAGPIGTWHEQGDHFYYNNIFTENNISSFASFRMLYEMLGDTTYLDAMNGIWDYMQQVWDPSTKSFAQGMKYENGTWVRATNDFATDCQTWAISTFGAAALDEQFGEGAAYAMWQTTKEMAGFEYQGNLMLSYTSSTRDAECGSPEWTEGGIQACKELAAYYASSHPDWAAACNNDIASMEKSVAACQVTNADGSIGYLYATNRCYIPFGWWANPIQSTASTAWVVMMQGGFNPLYLGGNASVNSSVSFSANGWAGSASAIAGSTSSGETTEAVSDGRDLTGNIIDLSSQVIDKANGIYKSDTYKALAVYYDFNPPIELGSNDSLKITYTLNGTDSMGVVLRDENESYDAEGDIRDILDAGGSHVITVTADRAINMKQIAFQLGKTQTKNYGDYSKADLTITSIEIIRGGSWFSNGMYKTNIAWWLESVVSAGVAGIVMAAFAPLGPVLMMITGAVATALTFWLPHALRGRHVLLSHGVMKLTWYHAVLGAMLGAVTGAASMGSDWLVAVTGIALVVTAVVTAAKHWRINRGLSDGLQDRGMGAIARTFSAKIRAMFGQGSEKTVSPGFAKQTIRDIDVTGKRVVVRVDYNVVKNGQIKNDKRITATLDTIKYLLQEGASVVLMSHNERPGGKVDPSLSLEPVAAKLNELLSADADVQAGRVPFGGVAFAKDCVGAEARSAAQTLQPGQVLLLENLRFHKEEELYEKYAAGKLEGVDAAAVETFTRELAGLGDVVVQDAFGTVHRAHASTAGMFAVAKEEGKAVACGLLVEKELKYLGDVIANPEREFVAILGGSKVSDKIKVIESLLEKVDVLVIGGAMAYTFLAAQGFATGDSRIEKDQIEFAKGMIAKAKAKGVTLILPQDHVVVRKGSIDFDKMELLDGNDRQVTNSAAISDGYMGVDIGPKTIKAIEAAMKKAKTVMWNGPAGVFEIEALGEGTIAEAELMAAATERGAVTVVGGGDSVTAAEKAQKKAKKENRELRFSHLSTGGGASLEFLEGKKLPGIETLPERIAETDSAMDISELHSQRLSYKPVLPNILKRGPMSVKPQFGAATRSVADQEALQQIFPNTYGMPAVTFMPQAMSRKMNRPMNVGVILSGGQAPGGHNVIAGIYDALKKTNRQNRLIGFLGGPGGIIKNKHTEITAQMVNEYRNTGGFDIIGSGRDKIEKPEEFELAKKHILENKIDTLIVIGGDDSNTNAALLAEYFKKEGLAVSVIGVPKTIDGDLKNEEIETSFGFDTATKIYASAVGDICRDARSAGKYWHFVRLMGRSASHITLEVGLKTQPNVVLIGEEVLAKNMTLAQVVDSIATVVMKRARSNKNYGVVLVPEGLIEFIPEIKELISQLNDLLAKHEIELAGMQSIDAKKEFICARLPVHLSSLMRSLPGDIASQLMLDRDPHGNVQVSQIDTEKLLMTMVKARLSELKNEGRYTGKFSSVAHFFGYEGRSSAPSNFDANYTYALGYNAVVLALNGLSGYLSSVRKLTDKAENWECGGIPLTKMMNIEMRKGKGKPVIQKALVDLNGAPFKELERNRDAWSVNDRYLFPGSIQYFGRRAVTDVTTKTLALEQAAQNSARPGNASWFASTFYKTRVAWWIETVVSGGVAAIVMAALSPIAGTTPLGSALVIAAGAVGMALTFWLPHALRGRAVLLNADTLNLSGYHAVLGALTGATVVTAVTAPAWVAALFGMGVLAVTVKLLRLHRTINTGKPQRTGYRTFLRRVLLASLLLTTGGAVSGSLTAVEADNPGATYQNTVLQELSSNRVNWASVFARVNAQAQPFIWKYRKQGGEERTLRTSVAGLKGFVASIDAVAAEGDQGRWALSTHALNIGLHPEGDLIYYARAMVHGISELHAVALELDDLASQAQAAAAVEKKIELSRRALDILRALRDKEASYELDTPQILAQLQAASRDAQGNIQTKELVALIEGYAAVVEMHVIMNPVQGAWPVLKAVVQLDRDVEEALVFALLKKYGKTKGTNPLLIDNILLMTGASPANTSLVQAARKYVSGWVARLSMLKGRVIYDVSAEITHWSGGLGPVMVFHGLAKKLLGAGVQYIEPMYQFRRNGNEDEALDYEAMGVASLKDVAEFSMPLGNNDVRVKVVRGVNKYGIPVYLIRDIQPDGTSFYTKMLYKYDQPYNPVKNDEFSAFFCKATARLVEMLETERMQKDRSWKPAVVHTNDGQTAAITALLKSRVSRLGDTAADTAARKALENIAYVFTTHTYRNRGITDEGRGLYILRDLMGIADTYLPAFRRYSQTDFSSGAIRLADAANGVSDIHAREVTYIDPESPLPGITNGATQELMARDFRKVLREKFGDDVDVERPTAEQIAEAKVTCKERFNELGVKTLDGTVVRVDPAKLLISQGRRLVGEKAGRQRAFTNENIRAMVKAGSQIVLFGAHQGTDESESLAKGLRELQQAIRAEKDSNPQAYPGCFYFIESYTPEQRIALLAATNIGMQDSDRGTGAAEFSEEDVTANGGLEFSPPWSEGVIMDQGLDFAAGGNTIIPRGAAPADYLAALMNVLSIWNNDPTVFYERCALSVRLNRIQACLITSAGYLRRYDRSIAVSENSNREDTDLLARITAGLNDQIRVNPSKSHASITAALDGDGFYFNANGNGGERSSGLRRFTEKKMELERRFGYDAFFHHLKQGDYQQYLARLMESLGYAGELQRWFSRLERSPEDLYHRDMRLTRLVAGLVSVLETAEDAAAVGMVASRRQDAARQRRLVNESDIQWMVGDLRTRTAEQMSERPAARQDARDTVNARAASFPWEYRLENGETMLVKASKPGLQGFLDSVVFVRDIADIGDAVFQLRTTPNDTHPNGDLIAYAQELVRDVPGLEPVAESLALYARYAEQSTSAAEREQVNYAVLGILYGLQDYLTGNVAAASQPRGGSWINNRMYETKVAPWLETGVVVVISLLASLKLLPYIAAVEVHAVVAAALAAFVFWFPHLLLRDHGYALKDKHAFSGDTNKLSVMYAGLGALIGLSVSVFASSPLVVSVPLIAITVAMTGVAYASHRRMNAFDMRSGSVNTALSASDVPAAEPVVADISKEAALTADPQHVLLGSRIRRMVGQFAQMVKPVITLAPEFYNKPYLISSRAWSKDARNHLMSVAHLGMDAYTVAAIPADMGDSTLRNEHFAPADGWPHFTVTLPAGRVLAIELWERSYKVNPVVDGSATALLYRVHGVMLAGEEELLQARLTADIARYINDQSQKNTAAKAAGFDRFLIETDSPLFPVLAQEDRVFPIFVPAQKIEAGAEFEVPAGVEVSAQYSSLVGKNRKILWAQLKGGFGYAANKFRTATDTLKAAGQAFARQSQDNLWVSPSPLSERIDLFSDAFGGDVRKAFKQLRTNSKAGVGVYVLSGVRRALAQGPESAQELSQLLAYCSANDIKVFFEDRVTTEKEFESFRAAVLPFLKLGLQGVRVDASSFEIPQQGTALSALLEQLRKDADRSPDGALVAAVLPAEFTGPYVRQWSVKNRIIRVVRYTPGERSRIPSAELGENYWLEMKLDPEQEFEYADMKALEDEFTGLLSDNAATFAGYDAQIANPIKNAGDWQEFVRGLLNAVRDRRLTLSASPERCLQRERRAALRNEESVVMLSSELRARFGAVALAFTRTDKKNDPQFAQFMVAVKTQVIDNAALAQSPELAGFIAEMDAQFKSWQKNEPARERIAATAFGKMSGVLEMNALRTQGEDRLQLVSAVHQDRYHFLLGCAEQLTSTVLAGKSTENAQVMSALRARQSSGDRPQEIVAARALIEKINAVRQQQSIEQFRDEINGSINNLWALMEMRGPADMPEAVEEMLTLLELFDDQAIREFDYRETQEKTRRATRGLPLFMRVINGMA